MTEPGREHTDQNLFTAVPEADAAEQATAAIPADDDLDAATYQPPRVRNEVDPTDAWEQALPVPEHDEGYDDRRTDPF